MWKILYLYQKEHTKPLFWSYAALLSYELYTRCNQGTKLMSLAVHFVCHFIYVLSDAMNSLSLASFMSTLMEIAKLKVFIASYQRIHACICYILFTVYTNQHTK